jgi:hypothetical protein
MGNPNSGRQVFKRVDIGVTDALLLMLKISCARQKVKDGAGESRTESMRNGPIRTVVQLVGMRKMVVSSGFRFARFARCPSNRRKEQLNSVRSLIFTVRFWWDAQVRFISRGAGYAIFLSAASATFELQPTAVSAIIRMDLPGADLKKTMQPEDKLPGITKYLEGAITRSNPARSITGLPTYAKTRTRNVYPGIDLVYYGTQGQLEYDFVLAPGADPLRDSP